MDNILTIAIKCKIQKSIAEDCNFSLVIKMNCAIAFLLHILLFISSINVHMYLLTHTDCYACIEIHNDIQFLSNYFFCLIFFPLFS